MDNKTRDIRAKDWNRFKLSKGEIIAGLETLKILLNSLDNIDINNNKNKGRKWLRK